MEHNDEVAVPTACTLDADHARQRVARWHGLSERIPPMVIQRGPETIEVHYSTTPDVIAELTSLAAPEPVAAPS
jgi:hypothetical protein